MTLPLRGLRPSASTPHSRTGGKVRTGPRLVLGATLAALLCAAACSSDSSGSSGGSTDSAGKPSNSATEVDVCGLLTAEEVTALIGENPGGKAESFLGENLCEWTNPENEKSVTLSIDEPGTAPGGRLEDDEEVESEPGPDGIRFTPGQSADFAIDDRACYLQLVVDEEEDPDHSVTIRLIGLVRDRF